MPGKTAEERIAIRNSILANFKKNVPADKAVEDICSKLGEKKVTLATVKKWYAKFTEGNFDIQTRGTTTAPGGHKPQIDTEKLRKMVRLNPNRSLVSLARSLECTPQTVKKYIDRMGLDWKGVQRIWVKKSELPQRGSRKPRYDITG